MMDHPLSTLDPRPAADIRARGGFTLVEILAASLAAALLLMAVYGIFQRAVKTRDSATERTRESALRMRAAGVIRNDLRCAYISGTAAVLASVLEGSVTNQKSRFPGYLRFTTTTGKDTVDDQYGDVQQVEYYISEDTTNANADSADSAQNRDSGMLVRGITRNLLDATQTNTQSTLPAQEQVLLKRVETFGVEFFDGQTWQESWQLTGSNAMVPQAIRVTVQQSAASNRTATPAPLEILVPWTTEPLTSSTASLTGTTATQ